MVTPIQTTSSQAAETSDLASGNFFAAVDLGSNSFHMVISRYDHGEFTVVDRQREVVRLAGGLDADGNLDPQVHDRAIACLNRFGQRLRSVPNNQVRVVGTNALRRMHHKAKFLEAAEKALQQNIEIIAGREEARLIYLGVSKWSVGSAKTRLVIDIGGGSTEIIAGRGDESSCRESLEVGCVVLSNKHFADGKLSAARFEKAILEAELAIQPVVKQFRAEGWTEVIGCSGTMRSVSEVLINGGWSKDGISRTAINSLLQHAIKAKSVSNLNLSGLSNDRSMVFAGGLAIIVALFNLFEIQEMSVSDIALREGVLYDLVGRSTVADIRDVTVEAMLTRWAVDATYGAQVADTAIRMFEQVADVWDIQQPLYQKSLRWASNLHELGLLISHDGYHRHGAYVVANADMAGFARRDQLLLAALIDGHRRKFPVARFEELPAKLVTPAKRMAVILRLAVLLHRERNADLVVEPSLSARGGQLTLTFDAGYLNSSPLTLADLQQERVWLKNIGIKLSF